MDILYKYKGYTQNINKETKMKIEVVASKKKPERLRVSGGIKTAAVVGVVSLLGLAGVFGGGSASALDIGDSIQVNPVYEQYLADVAAGNGANWSLFPNKYVYTGKHGGKGSSGDLPLSYDLTKDYGTTIKNQGMDDDCWAFATTTAIESNLKKTKGISVEFSPKQLDYLLADGTPYHEYLKTKLGVDHELNGGGNFLKTSFALAGQYAPVLESKFFARLQANDESLLNYASWGEYEDSNTAFSAVWPYTIFASEYDGIGPYTKSLSSAEIMGDLSDYVVTKYRYYNGDTSLVGQIKENVYNYGAAYIGTIAPMEGTGKCWDAESNTIVDNGFSVCNDVAGQHYFGHALAIVGWDDNHVYHDPVTGQERHGAFLLQNSWGESNLFEKYNTTYDDIEFMLRSDLAEAEIAEVKDIIENYTVLDKVWFAYDFYDSDIDNNEVDFASIQEVKANSYDKIYDPANQASGLGATGAVDNTGIVYTYTTGGETEYVESVSVASRDIFFSDLGYDVYIDTSGTGDAYEKVASITMPMGEAGQETIDLKNPVEVKGKFLVKLVTLKEGRVLTLDSQVGKRKISEDEYIPVLFEELAADYTVSAYVTADDIAVPNTGAPETGLFTGEDGSSKFGGVIAAAVAIAASLTGYAIYKNRKHLFRKVGFGKKGF